MTHDLRVALQVYDRVAPTVEIFNAPKHPYTKALFVAVPGAQWQEKIAV